jgi:hypothetical protein
MYNIPTIIIEIYDFLWEFSEYCVDNYILF